MFICGGTVLPGIAPAVHAQTDTSAVQVLQELQDQFAVDPSLPMASEEVVAVEVRLPKDGVRAGARFEVFVMVHVAEGWHINAHEPGDPTLIGLLVNVVGGEGIVAHADYPIGELYQDEIRVHTGRFILPVRIERIGEVTGEPRIEVRWQTCTDTVCLAPETKVLDVRVHITDER